MIETLNATFYSRRKDMKSPKILLILICLFAISQISLGQYVEDFQPAENWLKQYTNYNEQFLYHRFDRYSKDDVVKFKEKFNSLNNSKNKDDWDGIYSVGYGDEVGFSQLRLKSDAGFVSFYVYTCLPELHYLNFGKIVKSLGTIQLLPEFGENSPRKATPLTYVKIKWSDRHYLVEESSVPAFAEKVVGTYVEPEDTSNENYRKWNNYWVSGDSEKPLVGLPQFPASYKKFQRLPIETKIISVGTRTVEEEKTLGNATYYNSAFYTVTIGAGKDKGVKEGMIFDIPEIESSLQITQVNQRNANGIIVQDIDVEKKDKCVDDNSSKIACRKIKNNLKVKTQTGIFY